MQNAGTDTQRSGTSHASKQADCCARPDVLPQDTDQRRTSHAAQDRDLQIFYQARDTQKGKVTAKDGPTLWARQK